MADVIAALAAFSHCAASERQELLDDIYEKWKVDVQVMDKWLILQTYFQPATNPGVGLGATQDQCCLPADVAERQPAQQKLWSAPSYPFVRIL